MLESTKRLPKIQLILFFVLVCLFSCEHNIDNTSDQTTYYHNHHYDSLSFEKQIEEVNDDETVYRDSINDFLDNPFDYHAFKRVKKMSNSGSGRKETYYFKPNKEGMYYRYFLFSNCKGYLGTNKERFSEEKTLLK